MKKNSNTTKKVWEKPLLKTLDFKKTYSGGKPYTYESAVYTS